MLVVYERLERDWVVLRKLQLVESMTGFVVQSVISWMKKGEQQHYNVLLLELQGKVFHKDHIQLLMFGGKESVLLAFVRVNEALHHYSNLLRYFGYFVQALGTC